MAEKYSYPRRAVRVNLEWDGPAIAKENAAKARIALFRAMGDIITEANKIVPHDTGDLMRSGHHQASADLVGTVSYGDVDVPYAGRLHEHPEYHFQQGREGKWLEKTINESGPRIMDWLKKELSF